ncbi:hypothetical protein BGZ61DRAFT_240296 [Ilyonectria robusta]|uniref:uncharacterized protein n=1 Tax=Ilyonectria robusta TaxID=1079257 RepID=UPI001E8DFF3E|nr:uncharacterized protein BGZ61DRAFT_240296 [Ilyonectria robusta]KAH8699948.1 hypothetical protein BGZ61DRAFT_240296 [Ilyonectria robusta]
MGSYYFLSLLCLFSGEGCMQFTIDTVPGRTNISSDDSTAQQYQHDQQICTHRPQSKLKGGAEKDETPGKENRRESPRHRGSVDDCETRHDGKPDTCGGSCKTQAPITASRCEVA